MSVPWRLVVLILVYVALDLSLPAMPGAFVFDAGASIESVQRSRAHDVAAAVADPVIARDRREPATVAAAEPLTPSAEIRRLAPVPTRLRSGRHMTTTPESPRPAEDPH